MPSSVAFVGPTYEPVATTGVIEAAGFELRRPARRGDIAVLSHRAPGIAVLIDGSFDQQLAVGHAELRLAIERGWEVWGLASMGAIRAFEMRNVGMRGFGMVYAHFLAAGDFRDDEVALSHAPDPPYSAISEPLVHIRHCLAAMEADRELTTPCAWQVAALLSQTWFARRTLPEFVRTVRAVAGDQAATAAERRIASFDPYRVKTHDLVEFFQGAVWQNGTSAALSCPAPFWKPTTSFL